MVFDCLWWFDVLIMFMTNPQKNIGQMVYACVAQSLAAVVYGTGADAIVGDCAGVW